MYASCEVRALNKALESFASGAACLGRVLVLHESLCWYEHAPHRQMDELLWLVVPLAGHIAGHGPVERARDVMQELVE